MVFIALAATCAVRYATRHELDGSGVVVLAGAATLVAVYSCRPLVKGHAWWPTVWIGILVTLWVALTVTAPSFAWTTVPLVFAALQVLLFPYAVGVVVLMTAVVSAAWLRISDDFDPTVVVGPIGIALVTTLAYRALEREALSRQKLLDDLAKTQADLAQAQRRAGALAERTRLSREIHDSVGQALSSINLLLNAAEQDWVRRPKIAKSHVLTASSAARDGLDEVRRVVHDLAPAELDAGAGGAEVTARLMTLPEPPNILVLTTYDTESDILEALDAGAKGYLLKDAPPAELWGGIRATARGETILASTVAATLVRRASAQPGGTKVITEREVEVLELLANGIGNKEMALTLLVSEATVKSHLSHIYSKLGVDTRAGAVAVAIEKRIIRR